MSFWSREWPRGSGGPTSSGRKAEFPSLVIEITSDSTRDEDVSKKKLCYERLGIEEYFLHDPYGDYLDPRLQGYRLGMNRFQRILPEADGSLRSFTTGLLLRAEGTSLRLLDAHSGEPLLTGDEEIARESTARQAAEKRAAALEAELERLRRGQTG
jgi:hypothetical protein